MRVPEYLEDEFDRDTDYIQRRITADPDAEWPVEAGRYRLAAARACPWANRAIIVRRLLGLEDAISLAMAGPTHGEESWTFDKDPDETDPVLGIHLLREAYDTAYPDYPKGVTVPAVVDVPTGQVVTNDFKPMTLDFSSEWTAHHRDGAPDLYPEDLRDDIDAWFDHNYEDVNNGVYKCGFAGRQASYEQAYEALFAALDRLEDHLATNRFLVGGRITEADVRLWPTLVRFDAVYHNHFKCNRNKLIELPNLWGYARELFQTPGFGDTIHFPEIKEHYYLVHEDVNPTGVVPAGPDLMNWAEPHDREELGGDPWAGGTAPPPPPPGERVPASANPPLAAIAPDSVTGV